jgi:predicted MFS family arabinose efflux permease
MARYAGWARVDALRAMFVVYAAVGAIVWWLYRSPPATQTDDAPQAATAPLGPSRGIVVRLAALFSIDAFAGGLVVNSLLSLWLLQRFGLTLPQIGAFFFASGLLSAASQLVAPWVARHVGLLNTMVFTHIPSSVCLIAAALVPAAWPAAALALLLLRSALSQMDVPTRTAYVMAVVTPPERPAAASFTAVPRSLAAALSPSISGALLAIGWLATPLVACGLAKIAYDLLLWRACRRDRLSDEA